MEIQIIFHEMSSISAVTVSLWPDLYCIPQPRKMSTFFSQFDIDSLCKENPALQLMAI